MRITRINPDTLHKNPAFSQVATVNGPAKLIFVGGQNGVDITGKVVGHDIAAQTEQAFSNLIAALEGAHASPQDVVKLTIYIVQGQSLQEAFAAAQRVPQQLFPPPTISVITVVGLAHPDFLIEIEAIAAVDAGADI